MQTHVDNGTQYYSESLMSFQDNHPLVGVSWTSQQLLSTIKRSYCTCVSFALSPSAVLFPVTHHCQWDANEERRSYWKALTR